VDVLLTIGEFSKMTYLSVKALRHYHDVGLLEPAAVDPATGYRRYAADQVPTAQAIRRFRDLDMPLDDLRQVLHAPDVESRNRAIVTHLERMHAQLERTQLTIESLQSLLTGAPAATPPIELRRIPATRVVSTTGVVALATCGDWLEGVFAELHATAGDAVAGPAGALYHDDIFELDEGIVTAFVPTVDGPLELAATTVAVLVHEGPFAELDRTYAALGTAVAERGIGGPGPIREHYLTESSTEVCWPVTQGATL
jgi:DNA-binding transcriptional MerR regulator